MESLKTPVITFAARVDFIGGRTESGQVFMAPIAQHARATRPEERMNERDSFFPFLPDGKDHAILINKRHIAGVTISTEEYERILGADAALVGDRRRVVLECADGRYEGVITLQAPSQRRRTLDFVNGEEKFVTLKMADGYRLIPKEQIALVAHCEDSTLRPPPPNDAQVAG